MSTTKMLKPTESELEILQVLWDKKNATVREVHETLQSQKDVGYTTTLKLMQIMFEKSLVSRDDSARTHIYTAAVDKTNMQNLYLNKMVSNLFEGSRSQLVMQALGNAPVSQDEISQIQALLDHLKKNS